MADIVVGFKDRYKADEALISLEKIVAPFYKVN
jgi:hypothetical protein